MTEMQENINHLPETTKELPPIPTEKMALWLQYYLDDTNPETFLNQTISAKYAKYNANSYDSFATIGKENFKKLQPHIKHWLDEYGLSENRLKLKLVDLTQAKETKFFQKDGKVTDQREVEALEIQRKTLDMALKVQGLYTDSRETSVNNQHLTLIFNELPGDVADQLKQRLLTMLKAKK